MTSIVHFRDPIHGDITLRADRDQVFLDIIDTPEFQRLRRINQLAFASMVYHGAEHSRFTHSLGAFELMRRILDWLEEFGDPEVKAVIADNRKVAEATALLHDIGHGPFSHAFEKIITSQDHEQTGHQLILGNTQINRALEKGGIDPHRVVELHEGKTNYPFLSQLVASHMDVDRMDYLLRDSHMTGASYGSYDIERLIHALTVVKQDGKLVLAITRKGQAATESFLLARMFMHQQVYHHKVIEVIEWMLKMLLTRASELVREDKLTVDHPALHTVLHDNTIDPNNFVALDDQVIYSHIIKWQENQDMILSDLSRRFLSRHLLKTIRLKQAPSPEVIERLEALVRQASFDPKYYLNHAVWNFVPIPHSDFPIETVMMVKNDGLVELVEHSNILRPMRGMEIPNHHLMIPAEVRDQAEEIVSEIESI